MSKMIKQKKRKKYYKIIVFTRRQITVIEKQVHVNVLSCVNTDAMLYIHKEDNDRGHCMYSMEDISEYFIVPQKRKI